MSKKDYYAILGIAKTASDAEIKKAYRALAMKHHPDRNPGNKEAEAAFKEATEAYEILSDRDKRARYDQYGHEGMHAGSDYHSFNNMNDIFSQFGDVFENFFGGGGPRQQARRSGPAPTQGHDLAYEMNISLNEAFTGCKKEIKIYHYVGCDECKNTGCKKDTKPTACKTCNGSGAMVIQQGFFSFTQPCRSCAGNGFTITDPCGTCRGQTRVQKYDTLSITIPAGIFHNADLRVGGKGDVGTFGGPAGSLFVKISVAHDSQFKRRGDDLVCTLTPSYAQLVLGAQLDVPSLDGTMHAVKVPKGASIGQEITIPGKGFARLQGVGAGNFVCILHCAIPRKISAEAKDALLAYDALVEHEESSGGIRGFFKKFLG